MRPVQPSNNRGPSPSPVQAAQYIVDNLPAAKDKLHTTDKDIKLVQDVLREKWLMNALQQQSTLNSHRSVPQSNVLSNIAQEVGKDVSRPTQKPLTAQEEHGFQELRKIIEKPNMRGMMQAHDEVAKGQYYEDQPQSSQKPNYNNANSGPQSTLSPNTRLNEQPNVSTFSPGSSSASALKDQTATSVVDELMPAYLDPIEEVTGDIVQMVPIFRNPGEQLGITVKADEGALVVARILTGGAVERQGQLSVGDIIQEINGHEVYKPSDMQELIKKLPPNSNPIVFKIIQRELQKPMSCTSYVKAHFSYDPEQDSLNPCKEAGLRFRVGDILEIIDKSDQSWWQARHVADSVEKSGLVPSQSLEERRKTWVRPEWDKSKTSWLCGLGIKRRKKTSMYVIRRNVDLDRADVAIYEEVCCLPPVHRRLIVLVGAQGVGKKWLVDKLVAAQPQRLAKVTPFTSRQPYEGEEQTGNFVFTSKQQMEHDIIRGDYLEWGEFNGNLYGIRFDTIRAIIDTGKSVVLDLNPRALKMVRTSEFLPFVAFIAAPSADILRSIYEQQQMQQRQQTLRSIDRLYRNDEVQRMHGDMVVEDDFYRVVQESVKIERQFKQYFDKSLINDGNDACAEALVAMVESLAFEPHWLPVNWVY